MDDKPIKVLLIEDDPGYADLLREIVLKEKDPSFDIEWVDQLRAGLARLSQGGIDLVLLDLSLPDSQGLESFQKVHAQAPQVPIVIMTGLSDERLGERALQAGAQDYLFKGHMQGRQAVRSIRYAFERQQFLTRLEESQRRFRTMIEKNADGIVVVGSDGVVRYANPAAEGLFGRSRDELVGQPFGFPVTGGESTELEIMQGGKKRLVVEMRVVETKWKGEVARIASLRDITEHKRLEEMKEKLFSSISHDLRTPLNAMKGYLDLLLDGAYGDLSADQAEAVGSVAHANKAMTDLVNAFLDLNKMQNGQYVLSIEPLDLKDAVHDVLEGLRPLAERNNLTLYEEFSQASFRVKSDRRSLRQILTNLIGNAIKFTDQGKVKVSVNSGWSGPYDPREMVEIRVEDTGRGIEVQHLGRIFDEFYQLDESGSNTTPGTGLGLAICKRLVGLLGGEIKVESEVGKGTVFSVILPREATSVPDQPEPTGMEPYNIFEGRPLGK